MATKVRSNARVRGMVNRRVQGARGPLEGDATVEDRLVEQPKGVLSGGKWIGPCSVIRQESPDGAARLLHRNRVRAGSESVEIATELRDLCVEKNRLPSGRHLLDPYERNRGVGNNKGDTGVGREIIEDNAGRNEEQQLREMRR